MTLTVDMAERAINEGLVTYPGTVVTARRLTHRHENMLAVRVMMDTMVRSDAWPVTGEEVSNAYTDHFLCVDDYDTTTDLVGGVIDIMVGVFTHEIREFTKRFSMKDEAWYAPFHPHTTAGRKAWALKTGESEVKDLAYGTVGEV